MTRTILSDSQLPMEFWGEAVCTAVRIKNRIKSNVHGKTPYKVWHDRKPNTRYIKRFGCIAYILNKEETRRKFETKISKGIFVGYSSNNTYRVYVPHTGKIRIDCNVKFDENKNGIELLHNGEEKELKNEDDLIVVGLDYKDEDEEKEVNEEVEDNIEEETSETGSSNYENANEEVFNEENEVQNENTNEDEQNQSNIEIQEQPIEIRRGGRPSGITKEIMELRRRLTQEEEGKDEAKDVRRSERIKNKHIAMLIRDEEIPKNVKQAKDEWKDAVEDEMKSMEKHKV